MHKGLISRGRVCSNFFFGRGELEGVKALRKNCQGSPNFGFYCIFNIKSFEIRQVVQYLRPPRPPPPHTKCIYDLETPKHPFQIWYGMCCAVPAKLHVYCLSTKPKILWNDLPESGWKDPTQGCWSNWSSYPTSQSRSQHLHHQTRSSSRYINTR